MAIIDELSSQSTPILYDKSFQDFIEMHLLELRAGSVNNNLEIEISDAERQVCNRNFARLCCLAGIPFQDHFLTMRINGYRENSEFRALDKPLYKLNTSVLGELVMRFRESQSN